MPGLAIVGSQWGDEGKGKVIDYGVLDNNSLFVLFEGDTSPIKVVAEWCTILKKAENFETDSKP